MKYLQTEEEKKSFIFTTIIFVVLFILFSLLGLTSIKTTPQHGIAINFGTSDTGMGDIQPLEAVQAAPTPPTPQPVATNEEILTQETEETVAVQPIKKTTTPKPSPVEEKKTTPKVVETPKPSKSTSDALSSLLNGTKTDGHAKGEHGNDNTPGDKGSLNGNHYANSYYGSGTGKGSGWGLNGRTISARGKEVQNCNESGTVVVQITVNRNGNVIAAKQTKGTTNTNPCLIEPALATARKYKWEPDSNAPETQIGFITVNFRLGE